MDQEQTMLYEPLGELREVREVARNVMKPRDKNTFPIIFLTVRPTPHCAVKEAHKVQEQCKSKCYFFDPSPLALSPCDLLQCCFTGVPLGLGSPTFTLRFRGQYHAVYILKKGVLL